MVARTIRISTWASVWILGCAIWWWGGGATADAAMGQWTVPPAPPLLINGSFECTNGFTVMQNAVGKDVWIPTGWSVIYAFGSPRLLSTRMSDYSARTGKAGLCDPTGPEVTKMDGVDSWYLPSEDVTATGKPFDLVLYQQLPALYGAAYSLSGWMASECGSNDKGTNPCPQGNYIAKMIGIDPYGGVDHTSPHIEWVENRENPRWRGLHTSATALTDTMTVFIRVHSPFEFQNNKGFVDAFTIVRAPLSAMNPLSDTVSGSGPIDIRWIGKQSEDVERIRGGNYKLYFDVQARSLPAGVWRDLVTGATEQGSVAFQAPCLDTRYEFRVRARAEQPEGGGGVFPNHRYYGVWSKPQAVFFAAPMPSDPGRSDVTPPLTGSVPVSGTIEMTPTLYMPMAARTTFQEC